MAQGRSSAVVAGKSPIRAARPVVVLVCICLVSSLVLAVAHVLTAPVIARVTAEKAQETYRQLLPEAADFRELDCDVEGVTAALAGEDDSGQTVGYVVVAQSRGYGGEVPVAVAFGTDGTVRSIVTMDNDETPGLGKRVAEDSFIGQFVSLPAKELTVDDIDTISGATISSKAALAAFNLAVEAYGEVA